MDIEKVDGVPIARVHEDIDAASVTAIRQQLADALGPDALGLVIDLSEVRYLDSAGIDMLLRLGDRLDQRRAYLSLVIPEDSQLKRLANLVGLPKAVAIHQSLPVALGEAAKTQAEQGEAPRPDSDRVT
jgi:anti-sigma B factor antagonist